MAWDVTCPDTLAPSHVVDSAQGSGRAACKAEATKITKYADLNNSHIFIPLAFETLGPCGPQCLTFVKDLGRRLTSVTGDPREAAFLR